MKAAAAKVQNAGSIKQIKERFIAINRERLDRTQQMMRPRQRDFLDLLPLLFHVDHPTLPGSGGAAPFGVAGYHPGENALTAARKLAGSFHMSRRPLREFPIEAIFLMGSAGTVAFSERSDFDVWLCHTPKLDEIQLEALAAKAETIERWAATWGLEVHFFLMEAEKFRKGELQDLSAESSGSAQHHLLLDEFYRTGLWLAGRYPFWWLVPPDQESDYDATVARLQSDYPDLTAECIDFGGLAHIEPSEFFGAALWQVYKGIDSPYKSVLKITLIEAYASGYPKIDLLCTQFKRAIYEGIAEMEVLDPYLMLVRRLEEYVADNPMWLELIRRSFYLKVGMALSNPGKHINWRHELMENLVADWNWSRWQVESLDARQEWKINRVLDERKVLVEKLTQSYLFLSEFARRYADALMIRRSDLNILGRKLYAAFERKAGKIDIVNRGIAPDLSESQISIFQGRGENEEKWVLFLGKVEPSEVAKHQPLKQGRGLVELIAWCHFNKLMDAGTRVVLNAPGSDVTNLELKAIREHLQKLFPHELLETVSDEDLAAPPRVVKSSMFVNVGVIPKSIRAGLDRQLVSSGSDIFKFGSSRENLAVSFDQIIVNSWNEVFVFRYTGFGGLLECFCRYLQWTPLAERQPPPELLIFNFSTHFGHVIMRRVKQLYDDIIACFYSPNASPETRYVIQAERSYFLLLTDMNRLRPERADRLSRLMSILERPQLSFSPVVIDRFTLKNTILPLLFGTNKPWVIQLFYQATEKDIQLYAIDEKGSLFHQRVPHEDRDALLHHYHLFFKSVLHRQSLVRENKQSPVGTLNHDIEFYRIMPDNPYPHLQREDLDYPKREYNYFNVQVIGNVVDGHPVFNVYCDEKEFTSLEFGDKLFDAVARHIKTERERTSRYSIYITDLDLAPALLGLETQSRVQTVHFLHYKRRIENRLRQALEDMESENE